MLELGVIADEEGCDEDFGSRVSSLEVVDCEAEVICRGVCCDNLSTPCFISVTVYVSNSAVFPPNIWTHDWVPLREFITALQ